MGASRITCFVAGVAMSATSLGTTFTILSTLGFAGTRLGTVLSCVAMVDDVVRSIVVRVVGNLSEVMGLAGSSLQGRGCELIFLLIVVGGWGFKVCRGRFTAGKYAGVRFAFLAPATPFIGLRVAAGYAGTSVLFAVFLAGAVSTWWDGKRCGRWIAAKAYRKYDTTRFLWRGYWCPSFSYLPANPSPIRLR